MLHVRSGGAIAGPTPWGATTMHLRTLGRSVVLAAAVLLAFAGAVSADSAKADGDLVTAGKLFYYGVSVEKVEEALKAIEYPGVQSVQIIFNMFRQRPSELLFKEAERRRVGILARLPLSSGMLTGKFTATSSFSKDDHRAFNRQGAAFDRGETFSGVEYESGLKAVQALKPFVPAGATLAQLALRWILMFPAVTCAIPGAKSPSQVEDNAAAASLPALSKEDMGKIKEIYDAQIKPQVHHYW
jgi:aryl-alcohol dehydrogenase-like predicted oxidoreductase